MALFYKLYKNKNSKSSAFGKWFARGIMTGTVETDDLAVIMQRNCTVKLSDIKAVLAELAETMTDALQNSKRVHINGLGTFKLDMSSEGVNLPGDFNAQKHVKNAHVLFQPEVKIDAATRQRTKSMLVGLKIQEAPKNDVDTSQKSDPEPEP